MGEMIETPRLPKQIERGPHEGHLGAMLRALEDLLTRISRRANGALMKDGTEAMTAPLELDTYTTATLPTASDYEGAVIYVSDGSSGQKFRGSDGSSWVNLG